MDEDRKDRQLNAVLDSFLSDYSAVEPRPGLDIRIRAGLRARAAKRRQLAFLFAASAAAVVMTIWIARARAPHAVVPNHVVVKKSSPDPGPRPVVVRASPHKPPRLSANGRRAILRERSSSLIVLQTAKSMPSADNTVFVHERLYLSPEPQQEQATAPAVEERASVPSLSIQRLGVRPLEIKELASAKAMN